MKITDKLTDEQREKFENFKTRFCYGVAKCVAWGMDNPEKVTAIAIATITGTAKISKSISRARVERIEQQRRETDWYDPALFTHVHTKRRLTPREMEEVARRREMGETVTEILYDMNLIRR